MASALEIAATEAHIAGFGETLKRFEAAVSLFPLSNAAVIWEKVKGRPKRLQYYYDANDNDNQRLSGLVVGEMGKSEDLLIGMREARHDVISKKDAVNNEKRRSNYKKKKQGRG